MWSDKEVKEKNLYKLNESHINGKTGALEQVFHVKTHLGQGEWQHEPDRVTWEYRNFPCLILRQGTTGHLCGYVAVPEGHPAYGLDYDAVHQRLESLDVHGGLTYARACGEDPVQGVCHVKADGKPEVWWLGFDCAHLGDLCPSMGMGGATRSCLESAGIDGSHNDRDIYKNISFVTNECERLAAQLADAQPKAFTYAG